MNKIEYTYKENEYTSVAGIKRIEDIVNVKQYAQDSCQVLSENIELWRQRFTYMKNGIYPQHTIAIHNFFNECTVNIVSKPVYKIQDIYNIILSISNQYADWALTKTTNINTDKRLELVNFCKGAIGEYFWYCFLKLHNNLLIRNKLNNKVLDTYLFQNLCLRKEDDRDFGVDLIGEVEINGKNIHNCIFQIKFYSPGSDQTITVKMLQGVHDDGCNNGFISRSNKEINTFVCWLGTNKKVSQWISKEITLNECVQYIDINTIGINFSESIFKEIVERIRNIKQFS